MKTIKILIVDDHDIVRKGIKLLLQAQREIKVFGEAREGWEAIEMAKGLCPDVITLDIAMPRLNGLDCIELLKKTVPKAQIVIFSMHQKTDYVNRAFSAGALGYVLKEGASEELLEAIRAAGRGERYLTPRLKIYPSEGPLKESCEKSVAGEDIDLSSRELQVLRLIIQGNTSEKIADMLSISPRTVEKHRENTMKKLDVHSLLEMTRYAFKRGLIDYDSLI